MLFATYPYYWLLLIKRFIVTYFSDCYYRWKRLYDPPNECIGQDGFRTSEQDCQAFCLTKVKCLWMVAKAPKHNVAIHYTNPFFRFTLDIIKRLVLANTRSSRNVDGELYYDRKFFESRDYYVSFVMDKWCHCILSPYLEKYGDKIH